MSYYDINDEGIYITAIQRMLRDINYYNYDDASVGVTGIYDAPTRHFVMSFQRDMGLTPTGNVDFETWEMLNSVHSSTVSESISPRAVYLFPKNKTYDISPDSADDIIFVIQYMLREALPDENNITINGIYDKSTRNAVRLFKKKHLMDENEMLDKSTINMLYDEYEGIISSRW